MTHTLFVLTAKILIRELHEHLQSCLLQNYASNDVQYVSVVCLVHDLETKKVKKRNCVLLNFVNFLVKFFVNFLLMDLFNFQVNMVTIDYSKTLKDLTNHFGWQYGV